MTDAGQFAESVTKLIRDKYPNRTIMLTGNGTNFAWREKLVEKSYAAIAVVPAENRSTLILIAESGENQEPQRFDCSKESENKIAQAIIAWIDARDKQIEDQFKS